MLLFIYVPRRGVMRLSCVNCCDASEGTGCVTKTEKYLRHVHEFMGGMDDVSMEMGYCVHVTRLGKCNVISNK